MTKILYIIFTSIFAMFIICLGFIGIFFAKNDALLPVNIVTSVTPTPVNNAVVPTVTANLVTPTPTTTLVTPTPTRTSGYTIAQVASNNTASSCWLIIDKKVYDVTKYLSLRHPGGNIITAYCGKDSSSVFTVHNTTGYNELSNYYIGNVN